MGDMHLHMFQTNSEGELSTSTSPRSECAY